MLIVNAPPAFPDELGPLPSGAKIVSAATEHLDFVLLFVKSKAELKEQFANLAVKLTPTGMLWVAWPKKASKVPTDLAFDVVQRIGLTVGLVDTKICAINDIWSGLRFVIRVKDRQNLVKRA